MSKIVVLYQSNYGAVSTYAEWLGGMLGAELHDISQSAGINTRTAEVVICCGSIHHGRLSCLSWMRRHAHRLAGLNVMLLAVGALPYTDERVMRWRQAFSTGRLRGAPLAYARGIWNPAVLNRFDMLRLRIYRFFITNKPEQRRSTDEQLFLSLGDEPQNWCDKHYLLPVIEFCNQVLPREKIRWAACLPIRSNETVIQIIVIFTNFATIMIPL